MKLIDLHIHSTASDGSLTPTEVVNRANDLGLTAMALTDHDTVAGIDEALEAAKDLDLEVIPGIEVSCIYKGCLLYTSPSPRDGLLSRMPSSA